MAFFIAEKIWFKIGKNILLEDVNFTLEKGQSLAIIGSNGAGKTTLLKILAGFLPASQGSIWINGKNLVKYSKRELSQIINIMIPSQMLWPSLSVKQALHMAYSSKIAIKDFDDARLEAVIKEWQFAHLMHKMCSHLSDGEKQRLAIAMAFIKDGNLLCIDEPESHLDILQARHIFEHIKKITKYDILIATVHQIHYIKHSFSHVLALKKGQQYFFGETQQFYSRKIIEDVYF